MAPLAPTQTPVQRWFWERVEHCVQDAAKAAITEQSCGRDAVAQIIVLVEPKLIENDFNERFAPVRVVEEGSTEVDEIKQMIESVLPENFAIIAHGFGNVSSLAGMSHFPTRSWNSQIKNPRALFYTIKFG
jgi:hypothetical protein